MSPEEFLNLVGKTVTERGGTYGGVLEDVARMWSIYVGQDEDFLNAGDVALMMALLKILRARNNQLNADSYLDLAGYALLANPAIVPPNAQPEEVLAEAAKEVVDEVADEVTDDVTPDNVLELARLYTAEAAEENKPRAVVMVGDSSSSSSSSSSDEHSSSLPSHCLAFAPTS